MTRRRGLSQVYLSNLRLHAYNIGRLSAPLTARRQTLSNHIDIIPNKFCSRSGCLSSILKQLRARRTGRHLTLNQRISTFLTQQERPSIDTQTTELFKK